MSVFEDGLDRLGSFVLCGLNIVAGPGGSTFRMVLYSYMVPPCHTHEVLSFEVLPMAWVSHAMVVSGYLITLPVRGRSSSYQISKGPCLELAQCLFCYILLVTGPNHIQELEDRFHLCMGKMAWSHCRRVCGMGNILGPSFENTICYRGVHQSHVQGFFKLWRLSFQVFLKFVAFLLFYF